VATYEHTIKVFDDEIGQLRGLIAQMGGMAEQAIGDAIEALKNHDLETAAEIVRGDKKLDALEHQAEELAVRIIALRAPLADDLREVVAALKIAGVIERIGDYAKNIAKRTPLIDSHGDIEPLSVLPAMAALAIEMVHDVLDAFAARDAAAAQQVCARDRAVDDFYNSLFRVLVTYMMENPATIGQVTHLLFIAKNLERIGDHATNVAEMVYFAATGTHMAERDRGAFVLQQGN
jgi:phosphate transport system protein